MSKVQYSGFRTPYDEEQAYQRHMTYLRTKSKTSQELSNSAMNEFLGVPPVMPIPKTTDEILGDEIEVNRLVQSYLSQMFNDNPNLKKNFMETDQQWEQRKYPTRFIFNELSQDDKKLLITQYPAIKSELSQVAVLTPEYFLNFLKNYKVALEKSGGVSKFSANNSIDEIKGLIKDLPQKVQFQEFSDLLNEMRREYNGTELMTTIDILKRKVDVMYNTLPTKMDMGIMEHGLLAKIENAGSKPEFDAILETLQHLPTRDEVAQSMELLYNTLQQNPHEQDLKPILQQVADLIGSSRTDDIERLQTILKSMDRQLRGINTIAQEQAQYTNSKLNEGVVDRLYQDILQSRIQDLNATIDAENAEIEMENQRRKAYNADINERFRIRQLQRDQEIQAVILQNETIQKKKDKLPIPPKLTIEQKEPLYPLLPPKRYFDNKTVPKAVIAEARRQANDVVVEEAVKRGEDDILFKAVKAQEIPAVYNEEDYQRTKQTGEESGKGFKMANRVKSKIHPKFTMIGKGISIEETPKFLTFGKFCLSVPHLNNEFLKVKYTSTMADVPTFKSQKISSDFVDFLENFIDTQKINNRMLEKLPNEEQKTFYKLINKSGLNAKFKIKDVMSDNDKKEEERFNLVKGEFVAGNDSKEVKEELRKFIIKFMMDGRINKTQGNDLLFQLSI